VSTHAKAIFEIKSWDEKPWSPVEGAGKVTRAVVAKVYRGDITGEAASETLMCYRPDGTAVFLGLERIVGAVGGKSGSFVLEATGKYENGAATCECRVVAGSGTGGLVGLRGEARYVATHADYPNVPITLDYRFDAA
jgi:hypothetical protein